MCGSARCREYTKLAPPGTWIKHCFRSRDLLGSGICPSACVQSYG